jgi:hypothetical protein
MPSIFCVGGTCRADCLNIGAKVATGDVLLFLHADTILPKTYSTAVLAAISGGPYYYPYLLIRYNVYTYTRPA